MNSHHLWGAQTAEFYQWGKTFAFSLPFTNRKVGLFRIYNFRTDLIR